MNKTLRFLFPAVAALLLSSCGTAPVYRGNGIHCSGGSWSEIASSGGTPRTSTDNSMMSEIESWIGTPYAYGGNTHSGVDCSGFTQAVYSAVNIEIPRTASQQSAASRIVTPSNLRFGDLIFFNTSGSGISHVGIYLGNGFFAHASSSRGVVRESLSKQYYSDRIVSVGRFME